MLSRSRGAWQRRHPAGGELCIVISPTPLSLQCVAACRHTCCCVYWPSRLWSTIFNSLFLTLAAADHCWFQREVVLSEVTARQLSLIQRCQSHLWRVKHAVLSRVLPAYRCRYSIQKHFLTSPPLTWSGKWAIWRFWICNDVGRRVSHLQWCGVPLARSIKEPPFKADTIWHPFTQLLYAKAWGF